MYSNKLENLKEMDDIFHLYKLTQVNRFITLTNDSPIKQTSKTHRQKAMSNGLAQNYIRPSKNN